MSDPLATGTTEVMPSTLPAQLEHTGKVDHAQPEDMPSASAQTYTVAPYNPQKVEDGARNVLMWAILVGVAIVLGWYLHHYCYLQDAYLNADAKNLARVTEVLRQHRELGTSGATPLLGLVLAIVAYFYPKRGS